MAATIDRNLGGESSATDVGRALRQVRKDQGLSRGAAARSAGLTRRELAAYERGKVEVPESDLWCLAGSCGVDVSELLPRREPLRISPDLLTISTGDTIRHRDGPAAPDGLLREYLDMIYELRNLPPGSPVPLRQPDLTALADALGGTPDMIEHCLMDLIGASPDEAARLRAMILRPRSLPVASPADGPRGDPYATLLHPAVSPAVDEFFAGPPVSAPVFAAAATSATPPTIAAGQPERVLVAAGAFASNTETGDPRPSDPFAGPVDPLALAASELRDPFGPPLVDDPLAPAPLPPDPFAATPPPLAVAVEVPPAPPSLEVDAPETVDDPPAWHGDGHPLGINVVGARVVDDHRAASTQWVSAPTDLVTPGVAPIEWNASPAPSAPAVAAVIAIAPATPAAPAAPAAPAFERASAHWQIGGIFPATTTGDDGTLALRRADARWALTDLRAPGDCIIEATFDLHAGSGFGVVFRGSVDDEGRITGYSFDVDPLADGAGYLLRLWEDSQQHWRPLAQTPVADATRLYGHHTVQLALRADRLTARIDADTVLDVPALSQSTAALGHPPCRGERVGIQAWSTTEVTVESFQVASV